MKYYNSTPNEFKLNENKAFNIIILIVVFLMLGYSFYIGEKSGDIPLWMFFLLPAGIFLYKVGKQVRFNKIEKVLEISIFGFSIQKHELINYEDLLIVNHKAYYFINNGKEVKCVFSELNNSKKEVSIIRKNNFKDVSLFLNETTEIIKTITKNI